MRLAPVATVMLPGLLLSLATQWYVSTIFRRYGERRLRSQLSGAEVAAALLQRAGVRDVVVEETSGFLSDHYDPSVKVLRLSPDVYRAATLSAAGVAAHEAGHAIQHAERWGLMPIRQALVLPARIGSQLALVAIGVGLAIHAIGLAWLGIALFVALVATALQLLYFLGRVGRDAER